MNLQKYKNHLFQTIKGKLAEWLNLEPGETVSTEELYRFLHSIKGTSGTIGKRLLGSKVAKKRLKEWRTILLFNLN